MFRATSRFSSTLAMGLFAPIRNGSVHLKGGVLQTSDQNLAARGHHGEEFLGRKHPNATAADTTSYLHKACVSAQDPKVFATAATAFKMEKM